jgi:hypothetical protein
MPHSTAGPPRIGGPFGLIERRLEFGYEHGLARSFWQGTGENLLLGAGKSQKSEPFTS